ncbi:hypothetical protein T484DRAFT_1799094 [Baffinella frigidus]|nr:hypothetical protein T484DRAFT_1799094 [Cryptophyta sp. CCMP2293]
MAATVEDIALMGCIGPMAATVEDIAFVGCIGPMAATIEDIALVYMVMSGQDPQMRKLISENEF